MVEDTPHTHRQYYRGKHRSLWDKTWKDRHGRVVVWQMPNIWLIGWAVLTTIAIILYKGLLADIFSWAGSASLLVWSWFEIFQGVNYFRRFLGLLVLAFSVASLIKLL